MPRVVALSSLMALFVVARAVPPHAVPQTPRPVPPQPTRESLNARSNEAERAGLAEPFRGLTTNGQVEPGLFSIRSTGVSTAPVREAVEAFLAALTPAQRTASTFAVGATRSGVGG